jgi:hypothetical protein
VAEVVKLQEDVELAALASKLAQLNVLLAQVTVAMSAQVLLRVSG